MGLLATLTDPFRRIAAADPIADAVAGRARALTAAAVVVRPEDGKKLAKATAARAWQQAAFVYRRELPEVGYAMRYLTSNSAHIRLFAGDRPLGGDEVVELDDDYGVTDSDTGARDPDALPPDLVDTARDLLVQLTGSSPSGGGASILAPTVANFEAVGECWLVGRYDPEADRASWGVHSISEVRFVDGKYPGSPDTLPNGEPYPKGYVRLVTGEGRSADGVDLDPAYTTVARMWTADTQWSSEPDSPMRSLVRTCERLLLIERATDAPLRSRAAGNGFLLVPTELDFAVDDDDEDLGQTTFQRDLTTQLTTPLTQDGSAASVVPGVIFGPAEYLAAVRHLTVDRGLDPKLAELENRLLARLGIGLDVPPEIITGYADVNHWNVWQVTEDAFKNHQEPVTIAAVEALTLAFMRTALRLVGAWDDELIERVVIWYDPASLIAPADQREAANDAFDRGTISAKAHRRLLGLDDSDAPEEAQTAVDAPVGDTGLTADQLAKVAEIAGTLLRAGFEPAAVSDALGLTIAHTGLVPVTVKPNEAEEPPLAVESERAPDEETPPEEEEPPADEEETPPPPASAAPVSSDSRRLSRRLTEIDRRLRERLTTAADAALLRALERAGNRARARARGNQTASAAIDGCPADRVTAALGRRLVAALGLEEQQLLAEAFDRLRGQWTEWTTAAAEEAIDTAARIAGLDRSDPTVLRAVGELRDRFAEAAEAGWPILETGLTDAATTAMYDPDPSTPEVGEVPDGLVFPDVVRQALAVAGGLAADATGQPPLSGLTSGQLLGAFLRDAGTEVVEYEWAYGISARPFGPHAQLDGVVFSDFADERLSTAGTGGEWVGGSFAPGDHKGCHCDYMPIWSDGGRARAEAEALGRRAYEEQKPGRPVPGHDATVDPAVSTPGRVAVPALRR